MKMTSFKNCPYCGIELFSNDLGDLICPNHGIIGNENTNEDPNDNASRSYIG